MSKFVLLSKNRFLQNNLAQKCEIVQTNFVSYEIT